MAKKKKEEEKKNLPSTAEHRMLISPTEMVKLMSTLSPLAMEIFVKLLVEFQDVMVNQLKAKAENRQYSLFDDEILPMIKVKLSDLSVEAYDYNRIEFAVAELFNKIYHVAVRNEWGDEVDRYIRLFQVCEIPKRKLDYSGEESGDRYNYKNGLRRRGYIAMQFTQEAAPLMLTIDRSYTKFWEDSLIGWKNKHSAGMVLTLSSVMGLGAWTVKYDEFRRRLGFIKPVPVTETDIKNGASLYVEKDFGYANFSDMKRRVLDPVMKEVNNGCEEGRAVPFYFEYEPNYLNGKTRGVPNSITFKIHKSEFGRIMENEEKSLRDKTEIREFLVKELKIGKTSAAALVSLISESNIAGFRKKMMELHSFISDPKTTINDVGAYCVVSLKNWVETANAINLDKSPTVDGEYEDVTNTQNNENVCNLSPNEKEPQMMNPMWDAALIKMQLRMPSNIYNAIAGELQFESFENGTLLLSFKSDAFFQWLEGNEGNIIELEHYTIYGEEIFEAFGKGTQINYKQRKN